MPKECTTRPLVKFCSVYSYCAVSTLIRIDDDFPSDNHPYGFIWGCQFFFFFFWRGGPNSFWQSDVVTTVFLIISAFYNYCTAIR